ncbi:MAG: methyltransferase domain-containing protein [Candidatus Sumerlaeia bacterium]|nr:methyltransferase domain-containing protein [Candidatus Sumerlaeia bacterium]
MPFPTIAKMTPEEKRLGRFFDRCARKGLMDAFLPEEQTKLRDFLRRWHLRPGDRVLEPGCGAGRLTEILAEAVGPNGEVYACDLSGEMLRRAAQRGLRPPVHLFRGSAAKIERPDAYFDAIICLNVFPHFTNPAPVLVEFARVLKPNGRLYIAHFEGRRQINHFHRHAAPEVAHHLLPAARDMRRLMAKAGLEVTEFMDRSEMYWLAARRLRSRASAGRPCAYPAAIRASGGRCSSAK